MRIENNKPKPPPGDWEGEAADAAYARMTTFGNWLTQLSEAWHDLAEAASKVVRHMTRRRARTTRSTRSTSSWKRGCSELADADRSSHGGVRVQREMEKIRKRMEELQAQSDEVRQEYASSATFSPVRPADPPFKGAAGPTTTSGSSGGGGGGNAGDQPTGDPAAMAQKMGESLGAPTAGGRGHSRAAAHLRGRFTVGRWIAVGRRRSERQPGRHARRRAVRRVHRSYPPIRACGPQRRPVAADPAVAARAAAAEGRRRCPRQ